MEKRLSEMEKRIFEELDVDIQRGKAGHHRVFRVDVLTNTLRVTLRATPDEIRNALDNLFQMQLVQKGMQLGDKEVVSITDKGRQALRRL